MKNNETKRRNRLMAKINNLTTIYRTDCFSVKSLSQSRNNPKVIAFTEEQVLDAIRHFESLGMITYNPATKVGRIVRAA